MTAEIPRKKAGTRSWGDKIMAEIPETKWEIFSGRQSAASAERMQDASRGEKTRHPLGHTSNRKKAAVPKFFFLGET